MSNRKKTPQKSSSKKQKESVGKVEKISFMDQLKFEMLEQAVSCTSNSYPLINASLLEAVMQNDQQSIEKILHSVDGNRKDRLKIIQNSASNFIESKAIDLIKQILSIHEKSASWSSSEYLFQLVQHHGKLISESFSTEIESSFFSEDRQVEMREGRQVEMQQLRKLEGKLSIFIRQ